MNTPTLEDVIAQADQLPEAERMELVEYLISTIAPGNKETESDEKEYTWDDLRGLATYPIMGEEAQEWITRTRQEGTERREHQWNPIDETS